MRARPIHRAGPSASPRKAKPASAATAGSRLVSSPNARPGRRFSAASSNTKGTALDSTAIAVAGTRSAGCPIIGPSAPTPSGSVNSRAMPMPSAAPVAAGIARPTRAPVTM